MYLEYSSVNSHSYLHLLANTLNKTRLTEEEKRAISLKLGHANVGTTLGAYGYGSMNEEDAVKIVQRLTSSTLQNNSLSPLSNEDKAVLQRLIQKIL